MIFALFDYIKYKKNLGIYSDKYLRSQGFLPADKKHFPNIEQYKPGCALFYHGKNSFMSWLSMYYQGSFISHCAMLVEDGFLIDCTTAGVVKHHFLNYLDGQGYICFRTPSGLTEETAAEVSQHAHKTIGQPYGWFALFSVYFYLITGRDRDFFLKWYFDYLIAIIPFMYLSYIFSMEFFFTALLTIFSVYSIYLFKNRCVVRWRIKHNRKRYM